MNDLYTYIASPYSDPSDVVKTIRFENVAAYAAECIRRGLIVYSPICHFHPIAQFHNLPTDFEYWKTTNDAMMFAAEGFHVLKLDGWEESKGVTYEIDCARRLGLPIKFVDMIHCGSTPNPKFYCEE